MVSSTVRSVPGELLVVVLLLLTPAVAFLLISTVSTADAGPLRWLLLVVAPLALLGAGISLIARGAWADGPAGYGSEDAW